MDNFFHYFVYLHCSEKLQQLKQQLIYEKDIIVYRIRSGYCSLQGY